MEDYPVEDYYYPVEDYPIDKSPVKDNSSHPVDNTHPYVGSSLVGKCSVL